MLTVQAPTVMVNNAATMDSRLGIARLRRWTQRHARRSRQSAPREPPHEHGPALLQGRRHPGAGLGIGKLAAAAIIEIMNGRQPTQTPVVANTCYSFVSADDVIHVASVHRYDAEKRTMLTVPGAGGVSAAANPLEGEYAKSWARNIWADMLT